MCRFVQGAPIVPLPCVRETVPALISVSLLLVAAVNHFPPTVTTDQVRRVRAGIHRAHVIVQNKRVSLLLLYQNSLTI